MNSRASLTNATTTLRTIRSFFCQSRGCRKTPIQRAPVNPPTSRHGRRKFSHISGCRIPRVNPRKTSASSLSNMMWTAERAATSGHCSQAGCWPMRSPMPVTTLTRAELDKRVAETGKQLGDVIQQECEHLARVVTQSNQLKATAPVAYCLREVVRNVFEHAETDRCVLCAQKCEDGAIEWAVLDQGRGIRRSLEEQFQFTGDAEALRNALHPGVSRSLSTDPGNPWGNSGFGLYVLSELGRELGVFRVVSGQAALRLTGSETHEESAALCGTAIQLRLRRPKGVNLANYIEAIIARGESVSASGASSRASKSTRNFA